MLTAVTGIPEYRLCEYLLVLTPHEDLRNRILKIKNEFYEAHKALGALGSKPHITLAKFVTWEMMEERVVNRLKMIAMGSPAFKVSLKDYGNFPTHSIYIKVTTKIPIQNLAVKLREARKLMKSPDHDPHFITDPHITIARRLNPGQYERGWLEYSHRQFTASFIANGMLLLKKREGEKGYQIVQLLEFMNLPIGSEQGSLFI